MQYFHGTKKSPFNSSYFNNANLTLSQPNKVPTARKRSSKGKRGVRIERIVIRVVIAMMKNACGLKKSGERDWNIVE